MKNTPVKSLAGKELADSIIEQAHAKLAENIILIDCTKIPASTTDWFIICQGTSTAHTRAIADSISEGLILQQTRPWLIEGLDNGRWILIDYSDVVVHIMLPEVREYYQLEELWPDKFQTRVSDPVSETTPAKRSSHGKTKS